MRKFLMASLCLAALATPSVAAESLKVDMSIGCSFTIKLRPDLAPKHVEQITKLAASGFYNGVVFHRVIDGFMAQGGDPTGTGSGGSDLPDLPAEFSQEPFVRGIVAMALTNDINSANSQFFIMFAEGSFLNGQYTVWGQVDEEGMKCVDQIKRGEPVDNPDKMLKVTVQ